MRLDSLGAVCWAEARTLEPEQGMGATASNARAPIQSVARLATNQYFFQVNESSIQGPTVKSMFCSLRS
jgi:hypothetical protein